MLLNLQIIKNQKSYHLIVIIAVILISVFFSFRIQFLSFNYDFEEFFPNEDNELELYNNFRKTFEYDNEFVIIAVENKAGIFNNHFLTKIDALTKELSQINHIQKVTSPTNIKTIDLSGIIPIQKQLLHFNDSSLYKEDSSAIYQSPYLIGSFFPINAKSLSLFIKTDDELTKKASDSLANQIEGTLKHYNFDEIHYVGRIFAQKTYLTNLQEEFALFMSVSLFLVVIFLWFSFKRIYGIIVPMTIVVISVLWTLGIMNFLGKSINIMTTMLPTMIFVAGMSDVVHYFSKYFDEVSKGTEKSKIYSLIIKEVGFPTFLTLITTVVGFLSLLFSSIKPIREFGIYTSIGIVIAFILSYTLLPALLYFFTPKKQILIKESTGRTYKYMQSNLFWIFRRQKTIFVISILVLIISVIGISKIKVNNVLLEDLSEKVKIKQDFIFFDKYYSGVRPLEIQVNLKDSSKSIWDYEVMVELNKVNDFIKKEYNAGFLISPASLVKTIYINSFQDTKLNFPDSEDYKIISKQLISNKKNKEISRIVSSDGLSSRISGKIQDMGSIKVNEHNNKLIAFIKKNTNNNLLEFKLTGAAQLVDRNNEYMVSNMAQGFLCSILIIALLTFFLHRSWRMVIVFLIPNVFPLIIIAGIMGFAGIELKSATSLVFSIAFGIATDDTIHFISRLKIELGYGKSLIYAFKRTYFETGKPIILTTFILIGGFMSLMLSDFDSTFYFGFLVCITVIIAVISDIFLLPVLLFLIYGKKKKLN